MEIPTKFKIGDEVYIIKHNRICKCNVTAIRIDLRRGRVTGTIVTDVRYLVDIDKDEFYEDLFISFDQAVEFLRKNI